MYKLLLHRIPRELKDNWLKYIIMVIVVTISLFLVSLFSISYDSMSVLTLETANTQRVEDGEFSLLIPLKEDEKSGLINKGVSLEEEFYFDEETSQNQILRIFKVRNDINTIEVTDGNTPLKENEILVDRLFSIRQNVKVNDTVTICDNDYIVSGIGVVPDYNYMYKDLNIVASALKNFGIAFLRSESYSELKDKSESSEIYNYAYRLEDSSLTDMDVKQYLIDEVDFDYKNVEDPFYQDTILINTKEQQTLIDNIQKLTDELNSLTADLNTFKEKKDEIGLSLNQYDVEESTFITLLNEFNLNNSNSSLSGLKTLFENKTSLSQNDKNNIVDITDSLFDDIDSLNASNDSLNLILETISQNVTELKEQSEEIKNNGLEISSSALNGFIDKEVSYTLTSSNYLEILNDLFDEYSEDENTLKLLKILRTFLNLIIDIPLQVDSFSEKLNDLKNERSSLNSSFTQNLSTTLTDLNNIKSFDNNSLSIEEKISLINDIDTSFNSIITLNSQVEIILLKIDVSYDDLTFSLKKASSNINLYIQQLEKLHEDYQSELEDFKNSLLNDISTFTIRSENSRILTSYHIANMNVVVVRSVAIVVFFILAYILSVFSSTQINQDLKNIGILYALGVTKKDLISYYLTIPILISFIGGILGLLLSLLPIDILNAYKSLETTMASVIPYKPIIKPYIYLLCLICPVVITLLVNLITANVKLNKIPTTLINNITIEKKEKDFKFIRKLTFVKAFQTRHIIREKKTGIMVGVGIFSCTLLMMLGLCLNSFAFNDQKNMIDSLNFNYMTIYRYAPEVVPEDSEAHYIVSLNIDPEDSNNNVNLIDCDNNSKYLPHDIVSYGTNVVTINRTFANKFNYKVGSLVTLVDHSSNTEYVFTIGKICDYEIGFTLFMDSDSLHELFSMPKNYYNMTLSDDEVNCEKGRIYSTVTKEQLIDFENNMIDEIKPFFIIISVVSFVIMFLVMYILLSIMLERSKRGISLLKVLGYHASEISKVYVSSNFFYVLLSLILSIPLANVLAYYIVYFVTQDYPTGLDLSIGWYWYLIIPIGIILSYFINTFLIKKKLDKISVNEILKINE